jgi:hypothetical protein
MDAEIVEIITRKVMEALEAEEKISLPEVEPRPSVFSFFPSGKRILLVLDGPFREADEAFAQIRKLGEAGVSWSALCTGETDIGYVLKELSGQRLTLLEKLPVNPDELLRSFDGVFIPFFTLASCSRAALLIDDHPVPAVIFSALKEEKPVMAGADELNSFSFYSAVLPKAFLDLLRERRSAVEGFGIQLAEARTFFSSFQRLFDGGLPASGPTRPVITSEDIIISHRSGNRVLEFPRGSIITPLARETAQSLGVEIIIP